MNHGVFPGLVLLAFVPLAWFILQSNPPQRGAIIVMLAGSMFLPYGAEFDLPVLPPLNKRSIPMLVVTVSLLVSLPPSVTKRPLKFIAVVLAIDTFGAFGTFLTNRHPVVERAIVLPGLTFRDLPGLVMDDIAFSFMPFFVGALVGQLRGSLKEYVRTAVIAGLVLSLLGLFEIRMSPHLHQWVYGYKPHADFSQVMRWGGYRPQAFFYHGIIAAFFMLIMTMCAAIAYRSKVHISTLIGRAYLPYLMVVLVLFKSTGAILYALITVPLLLLGKPTQQLIVAIVLVTVVATYPYTRLTGTFPLDSIIEFASDKISAERAGSLLYRFDNEDAILDKQVQAGKVWFGWGGYGRSHVYSTWDGKDLTVLDGQWIILLSSQGVIGFASRMLLLLYPVFLAWRHRRTLVRSKTGSMACGVALIVAVAAVETLPNDPVLNLVWFNSGLLYGLVVACLRARHATTPFATPMVHPGVRVAAPGYARDTWTAQS